MVKASDGSRPVVIVTGAGTGLGCAYASHLAALGWRVVVNNRLRTAPDGAPLPSPAEAVVAAILAAGGHPFDLELGKFSPGKSGCPFHAHSAQWECYYILSGTGTSISIRGVSSSAGYCGMNCARAGNSKPCSTESVQVRRTVPLITSPPCSTPMRAASSACSARSACCARLLARLVGR